MNNWIRKASLIATITLAVAFSKGPNAIGQNTPGDATFADSLVALRAVDPGLTIEIDWRAEPLVSVLRILETLTGRSVIRKMQMTNPEFTFNSQGEMSTQDAILAIESLLTLNGIGVAPLGERFMKVVELNTIGTEAPELVVDTLVDRDPSGKVISKLFRLQYLASQSFQAQAEPFLTPGVSKVIPFENSNAVIVIDTLSNLQRLESVIAEVDQPSRLNPETRFYTLVYAQASEVAAQIQGLIDAARANFGSANSNSTVAQGQGAGARVLAQLRAQRADNDQPNRAIVAAPVNENAIPNQIIFGTNTAITSDDRTNQIIVIAEPSNMKFFDDIIEKLDTKSDPATRIEVIPLNHAQATEVASLLSSFVSGSNARETLDRSASNANQNRNNAQNFRLQSGVTTRRQNNEQNPGQQAFQPQGNQPALSFTAQSALEERESQFSEFMTIEADERSNALIISGTKADLELMTDLVKKIDVLLPQVLIEVIIAEVNLDDNVARGMDQIAGSYIQNEAAGDPNIFIGSPGLNLFGIGADNISFNYDRTAGIISNLSFDAIINTALSDTKVQILSTPQLMTTSNQEATFSVGQSRPIVTGTTTDNTLSTSVRETIQYQDIAIVLRIKPLIAPNDVIYLEIEQEVDDVDGFVEVNGNQQPIIGSRQMASFISAKNNELVVLGGMQRSKESKSKGRMSLLGEIPVIGTLFRSKSNEYEKRELLIFVRPRVIRDTDEANLDATKRKDTHSLNEDIGEFLDQGTFDLRKSVDKKDDEKSDGPPSRKGFKK